LEGCVLISLSEFRRPPCVHATTWLLHISLAQWSERPTCLWELWLAGWRRCLSTFRGWSGRAAVLNEIGYKQEEEASSQLSHDTSSVWRWGGAATSWGCLSRSCLPLFLEARNARALTAVAAPPLTSRWWAPCSVTPAPPAPSPRIATSCQVLWSIGSPMSVAMSTPTFFCANGA
jgi:hypothetical protein